MKLFKTLFLLASVFNSASACASLKGGGKSMGVLRAMLRGTMVLMSSLRESGVAAVVMAASMCASSAALGPMWRGRNSWLVSSVDKGVMGAPARQCSVFKVFSQVRRRRARPTTARTRLCG